MREDEVGRPRVPWRLRPLFKQISSLGFRVSGVALVSSGAASSLAARKRANRNSDRNDDKDEQAGDKEGHKNRESDQKRADRDETREESNAADNGGRDRDRDRDERGTSNDDRRVKKEQDTNEGGTADDTGEADNADTGGGGGGGGGGGNNAGIAGSELFDSPLATLTRRRADEFGNRDPDAEDEELIVDVNPEGESVYETDSVFFATGPNGLEILTGNIAFTAAPTPAPTPLPELELPVREPGFPFGEEFPFGEGSVFGGATTTVAPTAPEPSDPGDAPAPARADPVPAPVDSVSPSSDGGDNTMDFAS